MGISRLRRMPLHISDFLLLAAFLSVSLLAWSLCCVLPLLKAGCGSLHPQRILLMEQGRLWGQKNHIKTARGSWLATLNVCKALLKWVFNPFSSLNEEPVSESQWQSHLWGWLHGITLLVATLILDICFVYNLHRMCCSRLKWVLTACISQLIHHRKNQSFSCSLKTFKVNTEQLQKRKQ